MSIPEGRTSYFKKFEDPETFRLINQNGTRVRIEPGDIGPGYASCWDMIASPYDGTLYLAPTDESPNGNHTRLVSYNFEKDKFKVCFKAEDLTLPNKLHMPHSKLHTSISFLPDGTIAATTHTTARPPHHPEWMPLAHIDHVWDGYPGSYLLHYDPKTGKAENLGQPVLRESLYGATYDAKHNCMYMIGFMRGHVYRYSFDDKTVKDLGKAAEVFNYRLHRGPDGHIYSMTKSGFLYRANVDTQELEDLNWSLPRYPDGYQNNTWYRYMSQAHDVDDSHFVFTSTTCEEMFLFDCNTLKVTSLGKRSPFDYTSDFHISPLGLDEFAIDKYGVLWYALSGNPQEPPTEDFYHYPCPQFLIRWDFQNGEKPECLGIIGTEDYETPTSYCLCIDKVNDILYMEGAGYKPRKDGSLKSGLGIFMLDLKEFRPHMYEKGPKINVEVTHFTKEEEEKANNYVKVYAGEEVSDANPFTLFNISTVTPIRLWRHVPTDSITDSKVIGLAWDDDGSLYGTCGDKNKYVFKIVPNPYDIFFSKEEADANEQVMVYKSILGRAGLKTWQDGNKYCIETPQSFKFKLDSIKQHDKICDCRKAWLEASQLPGPVSIDENIKLPEVVGRRYLSKGSATAAWNNGKIAVGTFDGMFAIVDGEKVHSYGNAASYGPVRCMCTNADKTKLWGVSGHDNGLSTIFCYDDETGLKQLGYTNYNSPGYLDGPTASNILSSIALSKDEKYLAVGGADRIGTVHILKL